MGFLDGDDCLTKSILLVSLYIVLVSFDLLLVEQLALFHRAAESILEIVFLIVRHALACAVLNFI